MNTDKHGWKNSISICVYLCTSVVTLFFSFTFVLAQTPTPTPVIKEEVVVTANPTETSIEDTPASVVVFSSKRLESTAAPTVDDVLRQSVGFSIFRRSSSRSANPTTQGVSLRGVGASGASRSAVMFDGVPLTDPFGGWVQWNRVSPVEVEKIEVLRGGASGLYGDTALSGAVNIFPVQTDSGDVGVFGFDIFGGNQRTLSGSTFLGYRLKNVWLVDGTAVSYQTRGFIPIDPAIRGTADSFAGVRSGNYKARITRKLPGKASLFLSPTYFGEVRANGTQLQINRTHIRSFVVGGQVPKAWEMRSRAWGGTQVFDQTFSTINATRTTEALNRIQRVPVQNVGFTAQVSHVFGRHQLIAGGDAKNVRGASDEIAIANNVATSLVGPGGRQTVAGAFVQDFIRLGERLVIAASLRGDHWSNYDAFNTTRTIATRQTVTTIFADRSENAFSPQFSVLYHLNDEFSVYASASKSFRAPTLNELYRSFRVGNVQTLFNENLRAERAKNVEGGVNFSRHETRLRTSIFWTSIEDPVSNVTLSTTPTLITRQRQNAGSTRSAGLEIEAGTVIHKNIDLSAGYLFAASTVTAFPSNTALVGLRVPQVARHQFTFQARYTPGKWTFSVQGRASSGQFDDDLNQFRLEPYGQLDLYVSRSLKGGFDLYVAVENVFNSRYSTARTPIRSVSAPTTVRVGIRYR